MCLWPSLRYFRKGHQDVFDIALRSIFWRDEAEPLLRRSDKLCLIHAGISFAKVPSARYLLSLYVQLFSDSCPLVKLEVLTRDSASNSAYRLAVILSDVPKHQSRHQGMNWLPC